MCTSKYLLLLLLDVILCHRLQWSPTNYRRNRLSEVDKNWRLKLLAFPRPEMKWYQRTEDAYWFDPIGWQCYLSQSSGTTSLYLLLYDSGLSNSLKVSLQVSQDQNCSNASFSFMPPSAVTCSSLNYLLVLFLHNYTVPRLEGPYNSSYCQRRLIIPVYNLHTDASYSGYIVAYNSSLSFKSRLSHFTTTDVSWATLVKGPENMIVTCHFIPGSKAKGCFVQIHFGIAFLDHQEILHIPRLENSHLASRCLKFSPESHPQTVTVKDWKMDGKTGSLSVLTFTDERQESPSGRYAGIKLVGVCMKAREIDEHGVAKSFVDLESMWKRAGRLALFCMAAVFMIGGILLQCFGLFCRVAGLNKYLKNKPTQQEQKRYYEDHKLHWNGAIQVHSTD